MPRRDGSLPESEGGDGGERAVVKAQALIHDTNPLGILLEPVAGGHVAREDALVHAALADHIAVGGAKPTWWEAGELTLKLQAPAVAVADGQLKCALCPIQSHDICGCGGLDGYHKVGRKPVVIVDGGHQALVGHLLPWAEHSPFYPFEVCMGDRS